MGYWGLNPSWHNARPMPDSTVLSLKSSTGNFSCSFALNKWWTTIIQVSQPATCCLNPIPGHVFGELSRKWSQEQLVRRKQSPGHCCQTLSPVVKVYRRKVDDSSFTITFQNEGFAFSQTKTSIRIFFFTKGILIQ